MNCPASSSPPAKKRKLKPKYKPNNLSKQKSFAEIEMSEQKYLHWVLPLSFSRCISVMFNTWAAHQHGGQLNATVEAGKEPGVIE